MNWKSLQIAAGSNDSTKAEAQTQAIPKLLPYRPTLSEGTELQIRQAEQPDPVTVCCHPLNHTPFPPFLQVSALVLLHVTYNLQKLGWHRNTTRGWIFWMTTVNFFRHLWADMLEGHHVSEAQPTSFQFRLWMTNTAVTLLLLHFCLPAERQNRTGH